MQKGYAICFNEWIEDERITNELALLLKISSLTAKDGHCFASNSYFSSLFKKTEVSISRKIKKLESLNYIEIDYEKRGCEIVKRKIRLSKMLIDDYQKSQSTIDKNVKDNNTSNNNTSNNTCENEFSQEIPLIIEKFKKISPSLSYGNKTQRNACHEMLKMFGINEVMRMVDVVIGVQGEKYAPRATTPYAMWTKLGDFKAYFANKNNNKSIIAQV